MRFPLQSTLLLSTFSISSSYILDKSCSSFTWLPGAIQSSFHTVAEDSRNVFKPEMIHKVQDLAAKIFGESKSQEAAQNVIGYFRNILTVQNQVPGDQDAAILSTLLQGQSNEVVFLCGADRFKKRTDGQGFDDTIFDMVDSHMTDERKAACNSPNKPTSGGIEKDMTAFTVIVAAKQTESGAFYYERPSAITFCLWWLNEVELFSDKSLQDTPDDAFSILSIGLPNGIDDLGAYADRTIIHELLHTWTGGGITPLAISKPLEDIGAAYKWEGIRSLRNTDGALANADSFAYFMVALYAIEKGLKMPNDDGSFH